MVKRVVGIHTWEPGLTSSDLSASSGGAAWLSYLMEQIRAEGHKVIWISNSKTDFCPRQANALMEKEDAVLVCDSIFMPWRWEMPDYPERNKLYEEQFWILKNFKGRIVVHDEDHMIAPKDLITLRNEGVIITSPELFPLKHRESLHFPNPFPSFQIDPKDKGSDAMYIGNNYGRIHQTTQFLGGLADLGMRVAAFGNWLEYGPGRETPEQIMRMMPNVEFRGRLPNDRTRLMLSSSFSTIHLCKPSYANSGFLTMRWAEAAAAGIIAFIPIEFQLPHKWRRAFNALGLVVANAAQMQKSILQFQHSRWDHYVAAVQAQRDFVNEVMTVEPMLDILTNIKKR